MKKHLLIISTLFAFFGCNKEIVVIPSDEQVPIEEQVQVIKVNLTINRSDDFAGTKATMKTAWSDGDVIFIFFKGVAAPKYLEMKYDGTTWTPTAKNSLLASDLINATDKKMTAVFLPYGSSTTVADDGGNFIFSDFVYCGYFLQAEQVSYTYDSELVGSLNLSAPSPENDEDKYIHFDITGYSDKEHGYHSYALIQDYVKPITFSSVSSDGVISHKEGKMRDYITGYLDSLNSIISFSGLLDASVIDTAVVYQFSVDDQTSSVLYTRNVGLKTIRESKPIGIGEISNPSVWNANEYVDLGLGVKWAKCNLGATTPEAGGYYYAWGETEPKSTYSALNYKWCVVQDGNFKLTKYCPEDRTDIWYGDNTPDGKMQLDLEDDAAHINWGGAWRMPTKEDFEELMDVNNCSWVCSSGYTVSSKIAGYTENSIYLPAAARLEGDGYGSWVGMCGEYWSSSLTANALEWATAPLSESLSITSQSRYYGLSIRPVF